MPMASLFSWMWTRAIASVENITVASDVLVNGLSAWLSVVAAGAGWSLIPAETHQLWSALLRVVIMCCHGQQS